MMMMIPYECSSRRTERRRRYIYSIIIISTRATRSFGYSLKSSVRAVGATAAGMVEIQPPSSSPKNDEHEQNDESRKLLLSLRSSSPYRTRAVASLRLSRDTRPRGLLYTTTTQHHHMCLYLYKVKGCLSCSPHMMMMMHDDDDVCAMLLLLLLIPQVATTEETPEWRWRRCCWCSRERGIRTRSGGTRAEGGSVTGDYSDRFVLSRLISSCPSLFVYSWFYLVRCFCVRNCCSHCDFKFQRS